MFTKFDEYISVNEAKFAAKRKYTQNHPEVTMSTHAPVRNKVLEFIESKGSVTKKEILEFFDQMGESTGRKPSRNWIAKNENLVGSRISEDGEVSYYLTKRGKRVLEMTKKMMESNEDIMDSDFDDIEEVFEITDETIDALNEAEIIPKIEINTKKAEKECEGNDLSGELIADFKDLVFMFGEPAVRMKKECVWYLYDRKTKISYMITNKEGIRYKRDKGIPFDLYCNVPSTKFNASDYIQSIVNVEREWVKIGEGNEEIYIEKRAINE